MTVSGASAASSYAMSQQIQPLTQHKRTHPSISDVETDVANAATPSSPTGPSGKAGRKIDITA